MIFFKRKPLQSSVDDNAPRCPMCHKPMQRAARIDGIAARYICLHNGIIYHHNLHEGDKTRKK